MAIWAYSVDVKDGKVQIDDGGVLRSIHLEYSSPNYKSAAGFRLQAGRLFAIYFFTMAGATKILTIKGFEQLKDRTSNKMVMTTY